MAALDVGPLWTGRLAQTQWSLLDVVRECGLQKLAAFRLWRAQAQAVQDEAAVVLVSWLWSVVAVRLAQRLVAGWMWATCRLVDEVHLWRDI